MNTFGKFLFAVSLVPTLAFARSPMRPATNLAPVVVAQEATSVESYGKVVQERSQRPYSYYTIAIPVVVEPSDACTNFVGQQTTKVNGVPHIAFLGARDALMEACIAVVPRPVRTDLSFEVKVLTGGFVAASPIQTRLISIGNLGTFHVELDMNTNSVSVHPAVDAQ